MFVDTEGCRQPFETSNPLCGTSGNQCKMVIDITVPGLGPAARHIEDPERMYQVEIRKFGRYNVITQISPCLHSRQTTLFHLCNAARTSEGCEHFATLFQNMYVRL
jgi:hypothetical protein